MSIINKILTPKIKKQLAIGLAMILSGIIIEFLIALIANLL
jgi:hypothetical protein